MHLERPDLSQADPAVRAYIEALEAEVERLRLVEARAQVERAAPAEAGEAPSTEQSLETSEPPTTINLITVSASGVAKRTPRHLYTRQHRGGMGIFDLDTPEDDPPAALIAADEKQPLVLITSQARAFRLPVSDLPESPVRARGQSLAERLPVNADETLAVVLAEQTQGYLALLTHRGYVRVLPAYLVNENLRPGANLFRTDEYGLLAAACWAAGDSDLFVTTRQGLAIRFPGRQVPGPGGLGIRLEAGDGVASIAAVRPGGGVFLLGADGRGTIRQMSGFSANKAPGGGGKRAMKCDELIGAVALNSADDVFIISRLSKIVRFPASEVPAKEGVVQGVSCMALRADKTLAVCASPST